MRLFSVAVCNASPIRHSIPLLTVAALFMRSRLCRVLSVPFRIRWSGGFTGTSDEGYRTAKRREAQVGRERG
ncbi:MAG: hypothetical protein D6788_09440 [Planctomycetota bacterium]|nr:MAG: hypothetical protein D6788_09440 [Planctomycetota bacterium]